MLFRSDGAKGIYRRIDIAGDSRASINQPRLVTSSAAISILHMAIVARNSVFCQTVRGQTTSYRLKIK